ncbi:hypothetical protein CARUB_v10021466mg [Capsella rubella]|uniref:Uncharacterized protein n=1 Tax=Capsella rubella TaxID=81985 RepID=R0GEC2_9BRAS|nr:hypothetical protein CARUB_v10021466mg [Capsella rubella]
MDNAGEASSSRQKRQRLISMDNAGGAASGDLMGRSWVLFDRDLLDCPICCYPLTSPIFQVSLFSLEDEYGTLVVLQCFKEEHGLYVTVNCIAPSAPGVREFYFDLICRKGCETFRYESEGMTRTQKVSFEVPVEDYILIPSYALDESSILKMEIRIRERRCRRYKDLSMSEIVSYLKRINDEEE